MLLWLDEVPPAMRLTTNRGQSEGEESARRPRAFLRRRNLTVFVNCAAGPDGAGASSKVPLPTPYTSLDCIQGKKRGIACGFRFASDLQAASSAFAGSPTKPRTSVTKPIGKYASSTNAAGHSPPAACYRICATNPDSATCCQQQPAAPQPQGCTHHHQRNRCA